MKSRCASRVEHREERRQRRALRSTRRPDARRRRAARSTCRYSVVHASTRSASRREPAEILGGRRHRRRRARARASCVAPARAARRRPRAPCATARAKLSGICTASTPPGATQSQSAREERRVIAQPVQRGIAVDEIDRRGAAPTRARSASIHAMPRVTAGRRARLREHLRRIVDADDARVRPALARAARVTLPAPQPRSTIAARRLERDARQQIERRAQALAFDT